MFAGLKETGCLLVILDIVEERCYCDSSTQVVTEDVVKQLVDDYKHERLTFKKLTSSSTNDY